MTITDERWDHILQRRPEMAPHRQDLSDTIRQPNVIYEKGERRYYYRLIASRFGQTYLLAVTIANPSYFVATAWLMPTLDPEEGAELIWMRR